MAEPTANPSPASAARPRRPALRHPVIAGVIAVVAGMLVIMLVEWVGHRLLGAPSADAVTSSGMFAAVLVAWLAGSAAAGAAGAGWAGGGSWLAGAVAGAVLLAGAVATMAMFPHPGWVMVVAVLGMPALAVSAARRVARTTRPA
ncbi:hypothetical protein [Ideonella sp.]|uniref:hypothetical protein n=1 Tax=Ideonella sp. TaxID=1929293 RepID=UPI0035AF7233